MTIHDNRHMSVFPRKIVHLMPPVTGEDLFLLRHLLGISRRLLALRAGVSDTLIARWEKSPKRLSEAASERVEHALRSIARAKARELARHGRVWSDLEDTDLALFLYSYLPGVELIDWTPGETFEHDPHPQFDGANAENDEIPNEQQ